MNSWDNDAESIYDFQRTHLFALSSNLPTFNAEEGKYSEWAQDVRMWAGSVGAERILRSASFPECKLTGDARADKKVEDAITKFAMLSKKMLFTLSKSLGSKVKQKVLDQPLWTVDDLLCNVHGEAEVLSELKKKFSLAPDSEAECKKSDCVDGFPHISLVWKKIKLMMEVKTGAGKAALSLAFDGTMWVDKGSLSESFDDFVNRLDDAKRKLRDCGSVVSDERYSTIVSARMPAVLQNTVLQTTNLPNTDSDALLLALRSFCKAKDALDAMARILPTATTQPAAEQPAQALAASTTRGGHGGRGWGGMRNRSRDKCWKCGEVGHHRGQCPNTDEPTDDNAAPEQSDWPKKAKMWCEYHHTDSHNTNKCRMLKKKKELEADQVSLAEVNCVSARALGVGSSAGVCQPTHVATAAKHQEANNPFAVQVDCAADANVTCNLALYTEGSLEVLSSPVRLDGIGGRGAIYATHKGTVELPLMIRGKIVPTRFRDVFHVPLFSHNLISLGSMTDSGCRIVHEPGDGRRDGQLSVIAKDGKVVLVATQRAGSPRIYVNTCFEGLSLEQCERLVHQSAVQNAARLVSLTVGQSTHVRVRPTVNTVAIVEKHDFVPSEEPPCSVCVARAVDSADAAVRTSSPGDLVVSANVGVHQPATAINASSGIQPQQIVAHRQAIEAHDVADHCVMPSLKRTFVEAGQEAKLDNKAGALIQGCDVCPKELVDSHMRASLSASETSEAGELHARLAAREAGVEWAGEEPSAQVAHENTQITAHPAQRASQRSVPNAVADRSDEGTCGGEALRIDGCGTVHFTVRRPFRLLLYLFLTFFATFAALVKTMCGFTLYLFTRTAGGEMKTGGMTEKKIAVLSSRNCSAGQPKKENGGGNCLAVFSFSSSSCSNCAEKADKGSGGNGGVKKKIRFDFSDEVKKKNAFGFSHPLFDLDPKDE